MPWNPRLDDVTPDPRLDGYRDRVGLLHRGSALAGKLLVETEPYWEQVGGHLWWRRWSEAHEAVHGWLNLVDGDLRTDFLLVGEDLDEEVAAWRQGRFRHAGEVLAVT